MKAIMIVVPCIHRISNQPKPRIHQLSHEKYPCWLGIIQDLYYLVYYIMLYNGLFYYTTHSREAYQPTSIMRWDRGILHGSICSTAMSPPKPLCQSGASAAQQALLRGAPVSKRFAERQKLKALAIKFLGDT